MKKLFNDKYINNLIFITIIIFSIEIIFRLLSNFNVFSWATLRILFSSLLISLIITFLNNVFRKRVVRNILNCVFVFIYSIYSWLQLGFISYLGVYISLHSSSQLGAVKDYIKDFLMSIRIIDYLIFIPFILTIVYYIVLSKKRTYFNIRLNKKYLLMIPTFILTIVFYYLTLRLNFMQNKYQTKPNIELIKNPSVPTIAVNEFGPVVFGLMDLKTFIFPVEETVDIFEEIENNEPEVIPSREVDPIITEVLNSESSYKYSNINKYFLNQTVTDFNEYTGIFENKNLVVILMESVNDGIINEKYFPNFYKMYSEGWHWENSYSPRNSCATGNNEFSAMTGLYSIYNSCTTNVYKNNTYSQSIFNLFNNKEYKTSSMHNYPQHYYVRNTIHKNMYSRQYLDVDDLNIKSPVGYWKYGEWTSDEEFFTKAFDILLEETEKPWMTWLTTVSSHQPYNNSSTYGDLYKDYFKEEGYNNSVSRYFSKLKVLDNALRIMLNKLTESGKLDDTVIVLLADHQPYGLGKSNVSTFLNYDLDDYEIERTPFVIYNSQIESKTFTEYTSYINLVPTVSNLFNLNYDPRLYMGNDLLSETYESRVVFADGSWKNENAYYNASTSKLKYYTSIEYPVEEVQKINELIDLKISISSTAIKNNYFSYLEKQVNKIKEQKLKEEQEKLEQQLQEQLQNENGSL